MQYRIEHSTLLRLSLFLGMLGLFAPEARAQRTASEGSRQFTSEPISGQFRAPSSFDDRQIGDPIIGDPIIGDLIIDDQAGIGLPPHAKTRHSFYRLNVGFGGSLGFPTEAPIAYGLFGTYQYDHTALTGAVIVNSSNNRRPPRHTWDEFDALYGYAINGHDVNYYYSDAEKFYASFSAGVGVYTFQTRYRFGRRFGQPLPLADSSQQNTFVWGIGVPVQIHASYALTQFLGLGFNLYGNLNKTQINYGGMLSVEVGWF